MSDTSDSQATASRAPASPGPQALEQSAEHFHKDLLTLFDAFYGKVEDVFYDLADKASSDSVHAGYFLAMRLFRKHRHACRETFLRTLLQKVVRFARGQIAPERPTRGAIPTAAATRLGGAELEESLAIENLVSKSVNRYRPVLTELNRLLARPPLSPGERQALPLGANPFGPAAIGEAFQAALAPFADVDPPIKLVVYKLFDKQVMDRLDEPYAACLERLSTTDLDRPRPGGQRTGRDRRAPLASERHAIRHVQPAVPQRPTREPAPGIVAFDTLQRLLRQRRAASPAPVGTLIDRAELVATLSRLQYRASRSREPTAAGTELRAELTSALALAPTRLGRRALHESDETTLNLVFLLFEHILAGHLLPDAIKALMARLQIPILKVALLDKSFFDDRHHPARQLLNHMAQAAMGWTDDGDRSPAGLYGRIKQMVERIVDDFSEDQTLLAELDRELTTELARDADLIQALETKARQVAASRSQATSTDQMVAARIRERLQGYRNVPPAVVALLEDGWGRVLATAYLQGGQEGESWREGLAMIDRLLWSICPKVTLEERRELLRGIPALLRKLRLALTESSADPRQIAIWFKELQILHLTALRGDGDTIALGRASQEDRLRPTPARLAAHDRGALPRLAIGTWIQLRRNDRERARVKLIWQDSRGERLLFVDRRGRKTLEVTAQQLATSLAQGLAVIIGHEDEAIVDRAVMAMMEAIGG